MCNLSYDNGYWLWSIIRNFEVILFGQSFQGQNNLKEGFWFLLNRNADNLRFRIFLFSKNNWFRFYWYKVEVLQYLAHLSTWEIVKEFIKQHIEYSRLRMLRLQTEFNNFVFIHFEHILDPAILLILIVVHHQPPWIANL